MANRNHILVVGSALPDNVVTNDWSRFYDYNASGNRYSLKFSLFGAGSGDS